MKDIAEASGLDRHDLLEKLNASTYRKALEDTSAEAHKYGISSAPTFIIDNKLAIVGAQPLEAFRKVLLDMENEE